MANEALRVGIIGMGGFAGAHHAALLALEQAGACRVVCTCDPQVEGFAEQADRWAFRRRGVQTFTDYTQMLDACRTQLDVVTVPTPVPLHAPMHRACVERGLACYLEKPPTLDYAEMEAMLAVEDQAAKATQVGFNFIVEPSRQALKRRLLAGDFGPVRRVYFRGMAPRATTYFQRAPWAGRLEMDGRLILDSCIGNAMSHFLHNLHFWAGQEDVLSWEGIVSLEAELVRAHAIQGMDTVFARGQFANGITMQIAATHAADGPHEQQEWVECEQATLTYKVHEGFRVAWKDGRSELFPPEDANLLTENFRAYFAYVQGEASRPVTRLRDAQPFVQSYDLIYVAAKRIVTVPEEQLRRSPLDDGDGEYVAIKEVREAADTFLDMGRFPSQQGWAWAQPGGQATIEELPRLRTVIAPMAAEQESLPG